MVRREKQTIFLDATEEFTVLQLKQKLEPIVKKGPADQRLYNVDTKEPLDDSKTLGDCGYKAQTARAQDPASIGLSFKLHGDTYEVGSIQAYSTPPELPDVMKPQEGTVPTAGLSSE